MKEIKRIRISNFQSHEKTEIELCDGLNVFVGESRNGKTSILRALRWLYFNEPRGSRFIRAGKECCEVEVTLTDGTKILRIRDDSRRVNYYVLNEPGQDEQVFSKFNKEVPLEIQRALGVSKLWLDKDTGIELNFSRQMDAAFVVTDSPSRRAKIIGRVVNLHVIDSANRTASNDLKNAKRKKDELDADLKSLEGKMAAFEDLPEQEIALGKAQELVSQANILQGKADKLQELCSNIHRIQSAIEINNQLLGKLSDLGMVATLVDKAKAQFVSLSRLQVIEQQISTTQHLLDVYKATLNKLQSVDQVEVLNSQLRREIDNLNLLTGLNNQISDSSNNLQTLNTFLDRTVNIEQSQEIIANLYKLRDKGYNLNEIFIRIKSTKEYFLDCLAIIKKLKKVDKTQTPLEKIYNDVGKLKNLQTIYCHIQSLKEQYEDCCKLSITSKTKHSQLLNQYAEILKKSETCPICHTQMTSDVIQQLVSGL